MTEETRNITILSSICTIFVIFLIVWGVGSIKADRAKVAKIQYDKEQIETKQRWQDAKNSSPNVYQLVLIKLNNEIITTGRFNEQNE